jgi:hypothetical protein
MAMKKQRLIPALAAALLLVPLTACSAGMGGASSSAPDIGYDTNSMEPMVDASGGFAEYDGSTMRDSAERSIIRNGDISLQVDDPMDAAEQVSQVAEGLGGYVEAESLSNGDGVMSTGAYLTLRVPADKLDEAFTELGTVGTVLSQSRSAVDVTTQHVDLQARVKALEESVERLTELMAGSATTGDLLEAESALSQRQQELDGLRAQLEALEGQVDQATISVSLTTKSTLPGGPDNFWEGLVAGWESIAAAGAGALVLLGILLPWLVLAGVIALVIVLIVRSARRRGRRNRAAQQSVTQEAGSPAQSDVTAQHAPHQAPQGPAPQEPPYL